MTNNEANPYRSPTGQYVSYAAQQKAKTYAKLLALRQFAPTVYTDQGPFAKLGVQRHEAKVRLAELDAGLWEGRAAE